MFAAFGDLLGEDTKPFADPCLKIRQLVEKLNANGQGESAAVVDQVLNKAAEGFVNTIEEMEDLLRVSTNAAERLSVFGKHEEATVLTTAIKQMRPEYVLVMPWADATLSDELRAKQFAGSDMDQVRCIMWDVGQALKQMHGTGYIHGDANLHCALRGVYFVSHLTAKHFSQLLWQVM